MILTLLALALLARLVLATIDPALTDMFNNLLNAAMLIYLARMDRKITPRVEHIDESVKANIETRQPGGRREHDPSDNCETSATSATS